MDFAKTVQCDICGDTYELTKGHTCSGMTQEWRNGTWQRLADSRNAGGDATLGDILAELQRIRQELERQRR